MTFSPFLFTAVSVPAVRSNISKVFGLLVLLWSFYHGAKKILIVRGHGPPWLKFKPQKILNVEFDADPDPDATFQSKADPDPAFNSGSGSAAPSFLLNYLLKRPSHELICTVSVCAGCGRCGRPARSGRSPPPRLARITPSPFSPRAFADPPTPFSSAQLRLRLTTTTPISTLSAFHSSRYVF